jgi:hypothetical protein
MIGSYFQVITLEALFMLVQASVCLSDDLQITGRHETRTANGAEWYRNDEFIGFAL